MEKQYIVYKFRLYPTKEQKVQIDKTIGCCRFIYNWALDYRNKAHENGEKFPSDFDVNKILKDLKSEYEWLKETDSMSLVCSVKNNGAAFKNFFEGRAKHPTRKKKQSKGSYETQLSGDPFIDINNGYVKIPKLGMTRVKAHRYVDINNVKNYSTISRNTIGEYYISIKVLVDAVEETNAKATIENTIGIDLGVKDLAILDDGTTFHKFKIDRKVIKKKKRLQRQLARKVGNNKGEKKSNNYKKLQHKLAKIDLTIARKREKYQYEVIKEITNRECDYIGMEDLNVKGMGKKGGKRKKGLNKGVANSAMGEFNTRMKLKAASKGKKLVEIDRFYPSSKTCHHCGYIYRKLKLKERTWICTECGTKLKRDQNAAINIKNMAVESQKNLPKCIGKVKPVESDTKLNKKKQPVSSSLAPCEAGNSIQNTVEKSCMSTNYIECTVTV